MTVIWRDSAPKSVANAFVEAQKQILLIRICYFYVGITQLMVHLLVGFVLLRALERKAMDPY